MFIASTAGLMTGHSVVSLLDTKKGSLTNRAECAKEHFKNDLNLTVKTALGGAAVAGVIYKPNIAVNIASTIGSGIVKAGKYIANKLPKLGLKDSKFLKDLAKNPTKLGVAGLVIAGGLFVVDTIAKYANKSGRIDQKYEDTAKIEGSTKNVILR